MTGLNSSNLELSFFFKRPIYLLLCHRELAKFIKVIKVSNFASPQGYMLHLFSRGTPYGIFYSIKKEYLEINDYIIIVKAGI